MLISILQKIPMIIVLFLLCAAIAVLYSRCRNVSKSEFVKIFKTANYIQAWVLAVTIILTGTFGVFNYMKSRQWVQAVLSLNYSEASQAQNSNGTRYNMAEITCDEVLQKAIEMGAFEDVTVKELKECLYVYPYVQGGAENEWEYHISTEFVVEYGATRHTSHLDAENVIKLITAAYKEYYIEKYTDNFGLDTGEEKPDLSQVEYMDVVSYFEKESTAVLNYLYEMAGKSQSFVTSNNQTFNSIAGEVHQFKETQIEQNLKSLILQKGIARDHMGYVERLSYRNNNTDFDRRKNASSFDLCNRAIDMYSEEMTRVVLVPTWDEAGKYYMGRTKVGIDELSVMATNFSDAVATNEKEILDNNLIIDKMQSASGNGESYKEVDEMILSIDESIKNFAAEAIAAGREFSNYRMNQCISVSISGVSLLSQLKTILMFAALAYVSAMLYVIAKKFPGRE